MVRGNVHKVTEVFWPKKYCALNALSEMLFVLEEKFIIRVKYEFNDNNACIFFVWVLNFACLNFVRIFFRGSLISRFFYNREKREIKDPRN